MEMAVALLGHALQVEGPQAEGLGDSVPRREGGGGSSRRGGRKLRGDGGGGGVVLMLARHALLSPLAQEGALRGGATDTSLGSPEAARVLGASMEAGYLCASYLLFQGRGAHLEPLTPAAARVRQGALQVRRALTVGGGSGFVVEGGGVRQGAVHPHRVEGGRLGGGRLGEGAGGALGARGGHLPGPPAQPRVGEAGRLEGLLHP